MMNDSAYFFDLSDIEEHDRLAKEDKERKNITVDEH